MIYVVATTQVKPESARRLYQGRKECIAETRKEKGCISYESHASINDPNPIRGGRALGNPRRSQRPRQAPHMKVWREYSAPLKASPTVIEIISDGKVDKIKA